MTAVFNHLLPPQRDLLYSLSFWCFTSPHHSSHHWMCKCVALCCSPVALLYPLTSPRSYLLITQFPSSSIPFPLYMMEQMHSFPLNLAGIQKLTAADNVTTIQQRATEREKEKQRMMVQRKKRNNRGHKLISQQGRKGGMGEAMDENKHRETLDRCSVSDLNELPLKAAFKEA